LQGSACALEVETTPLIRILLTILCLALARTAPAQDESKALQAFSLAFRHGAQQPPKPVEQRLAAVAQLAGLDSPRTAEAVADAHGRVQAEATALDTERQATNEEMAKLVKGQETVEPRTMPKKEHDRYQVLKDQARTQREQVDALRGLLAALEDRLAGLRRKDSLLWLLGSANNSEARGIVS